MDRSAAHARHDEFLLARFFGDDVDERERARARDLISTCPDCAAFYADLEAIASATAALPVPARPRDFTLTEADSARLNPARSGWLSGLVGRTRMLGSSMAALGMAGIVLVGAITALAPAGGLNTTQGGEKQRPAFAAASDMPTAGPAGPELSNADQAGAGSSQAVPQATAAPSAAPTGERAAPSPAASTVALAPSPAPMSSAGAPTPSETSAPEGLGIVSPGPSGSGEGVTDTSGKSAGGSAEATQMPGPPAGSAVSNGPDARLVALAGSAALLVAGLLLLAAPRLARRRSGSR
jgi:hypothetical protein